MVLSVSVNRSALSKNLKPWRMRPGPSASRGDGAQLCLRRGCGRSSACYWPKSDCARGARKLNKVGRELTNYRMESDKARSTIERGGQSGSKRYRCA
jgi:hypothetical protein